MELFDYTYDKQPITFQLQEQNVMVNATEMSKLFGKQVNHFMDVQSTKDFISACLNSRNSGNLKVEKEEDLYTSKQKSGTWMHRVLALKFAAWLNPDFEVWVYSTIDHILFDRYRRMEESLKKSARRKNRLETLTQELIEIPAFLEYQQIKLEERQESYRRGKFNKNQMDMFREAFKNT